MRIIKRGIPPQERLFAATCRSCHTEIEFKKSEGKVTASQRDGDFITVVCPVCGRSVHANL